MQDGSPRPISLLSPSCFQHSIDRLSYTRTTLHPLSPPSRRLGRGTSTPQAASMDVQDLCLPRVSGILILDADGGRIACKAFAPRLQSSGALKALQARIFQRSKLTSGAEIGDVFLLDEYSVVFKGSSDALFYVVGDNAENELILQAVLDALVETLAGLLRGLLDRRMLLDNLAIVLLALDEVVDSGMILETNPQALRQRVMMRRSEDGTNQAMSELTISEALNQARESMIKTIGRT